MSSWQPRLTLENELKKLESSLTANPDAVGMCFERAATLAKLGRNEEAMNAYFSLLARAPTHFDALNNVGKLLKSTGFKAEARKLYNVAILQQPDNPTGYVNLANLLVKDGELEAAIKNFEEAIRLAPEHIDANQGLAYLLTEFGDEKRAAVCRVKGFQPQPVRVLPYYGEAEPITLLVLASAIGGTVPIHHHLDECIFLTSVLFVDFYDPLLPFPPHHFVLNAIGDADICQPSLAAAVKILKERSTAPIINPPAAVMQTGRAENAERLGRIPGVITPKMQLFSRRQLGCADTASLLARHGFVFPLLLRPPGFHTGRFFVRVENEAALADALSTMPGQELMVIEYLDARSADGKIRKYRVMMIDGKLYPLHAAISHEWKIHYFSAEMADNPENRAEDAAFLENMPKVLGAKAMAALEQIRDALGLDYAGADFSVSADGEIILFEANATMVVNPPEADKRWDYRRPATRRVLDAIQGLLRKYAPKPKADSLPTLEGLLVSGGDGRIALDKNGVNKYGCRPVPQSGILSFSSCTASTISKAGFAASKALYERLTQTPVACEMDRVRDELISLLDLSSLSPEIIFGASGTDLHRVAAQLAPSLIVMPEASETGSGVPGALSGDGIEIAAIKSRMENGTLRPVSVVDAEVKTLVTNAVSKEQRVLLILTDVSKTGLIIPSVACAIALKKRFPKMLDVLVDACQFRLSNAIVRAYLEQDFMLAVTGSKFITGPAFSGALFVPKSMAGRLRHEQPANVGLLLRWEAALAELRAFHALPEKNIRAFLEQFAASVQKTLAEDPAFEALDTRDIDRMPLAGNLWDSIPTIFSFRLRNREETQRIYQSMMGQGFQLGQPAACGALRLCVDMRLVVQALIRDPDAIIADALRVLGKAAAMVSVTA